MNQTLKRPWCIRPLQLQEAHRTLPDQLLDGKDRDVDPRDLPYDGEGREVEQTGLRDRSQTQGRRTAFEADVRRRQPRVTEGLAQFLLRAQARFCPGPTLAEEIAQFDSLSPVQAMTDRRADDIVVVAKVLANEALGLNRHVVDDKIEFALPERGHHLVVVRDDHV